MKTKSEIINETAAFYNSKNRSVVVTIDEEYRGEDTECRYFGPNGERCALSRCCLETEEVINFLTESENMSADIVLETAESDEIEILKEEYRGHGGEFWCDLQCFHDNSHNWDENGLTEYGVKREEYLLEKWSK